MNASRVFAVLAAAALTVAGCGTAQEQSTSVGGAPGTVAAVAARSVTGGTRAWTSCRQVLGTAWPVATSTDTLTLTRLDADFSAASVVRCDEQTQTRGDGGQELVATEDHAAGVAALVAALRLPDEPATTGPCADVLQTVPWFVLLDAHRRWVRPGVPFDLCHQPRVEVLDALRALHLDTVSTTPVRLLESGAAVKSGCGSDWADMVHVETTGSGGARPAGTRADPFAGNSRLRLCVYTVPAAESGGLKPAGTFTRGGLLAGATRARLGSLLTGLPPAAACTRETTQFAVISRTTPGWGSTVYLELDGCGRVLVETSLKSGAYTRDVSTLAQASAALTAAVDGFHPSP